MDYQTLFHKETTIGSFVHHLRDWFSTFEIKENNQKCFELYDGLIRLRHDVFHYCIQKALRIPYTSEKTLKEHFPKLEHEDSMRTPDIVYRYSDFILISDVTFTTKYYESLENKRHKYDYIATVIERVYNTPVRCIYLIYDYNKNNLDLQLSKINYLFEERFDKRFFEEAIHALSLFKDTFCKQISKESLENYLKNKYNLGVSSDDKIYSKDFDITEELLNKICENKYPFKTNYNHESTDNFLNLAKEILEDEGNPIFIKYLDEKNDSSVYKSITDEITNSNDKYEKRLKPVHHNLVPFFEELTNLPKINGENSEQIMINNMCSFLLNNINDDVDHYFGLIKEISDATCQLYKNKANKLCFEKGYYIENQKDIKNEYKEIIFGEKEKDKNPETQEKIYSVKSKKRKNTQNNENIDKTMSFYDYLVEKDYIKPLSNDLQVKRQKTLQIPNKFFTSNSKEILIKSGIEFWKHFNKTKEEYFERKVKVTTADFDQTYLVDDMIKKLSDDSPNNTYYDDQINNIFSFTTEVDKIDDDDYIKDMKKKLVEEYRDPLSILLKTNAFYYLWFNHHFNTQLMHFMSLSLKPKNYYLFNCGIPNFLCLALGGYRSIDSESGKAFLTMVITDKPNQYTGFFGNLKKMKLKNNYWLIITTWRRLPMSKITHMRDSCYSVLSSSLNYFMNLRKTNLDMVNVKIRRMLSVKTIISLCTTQQVAEFLMDNRYATMSAFSSYTNMKKLMIEKFSPPYNNVLSAWIIKTLLIRLPLITNDVITNENIYFKIPEFDKGKRMMDTIGGHFKIPSIWLGENVFVYEPQELLEEIFIYVHTMKEPSNQYHENIKALKTIIKYQDIFDCTKDKFKYGNLVTKDDYVDFLLNNDGIGFCHSIIVDSTKHTIDKTKPFFSKYIHDVLTEPVSEIVSTKAVIHTLDRQLNELDNTKRKEKEHKKRIQILKKKNYTKDQIELFNECTKDKKGKIYLESKSHFYRTKIRQKVWETTIEYLEKNKDVKKVIDIVEKHFKEDDGQVEADICIKAQFGAKREFYVINFGAKASARITEKFFQKLSEDTQNEAISIPGDRKIMSIQGMLDDAVSLSVNKGMKIRYVNGDCTKWSAAETMGSFLAMCDGLNTGNTKFEKLLKSVFSTWADKKINIPPIVIDKVQPIIDGTKYLKKAGLTQSQIKSTHNFLQGMFNYASSYKAVCCANYTISVWEKIYGTDKIYVSHMEHSDDYVMIILYKNESDFIKFRILHKIMMRLHGYSDSERKTSCQQLFLEFVSLMSFNGVMLYPHIKKSKEINLNLPCTGYKSDMQAALSRAGECLRVGCNLPFNYFFQKLHVYCLAEAYSLLPNMLNDFKSDHFNTPIELYGFPDQHPIFSLLCTGDINNYRIYNYSVNGKQKINGLYNLSKKTYEENPDESHIMGEKEQAYSLFHPRYLFDYDNKSIVNIRKVLKMSFEEITDFWKKHVSYRFVKPNDRETLILWLKAMMYNRSFIEAYSATSRTKMTLRISKYVKTPTLLMNITHEDLNKKIGEKEGLLMMKECYNKMMESIDNNNKITDDKEINILKKLLVKCDANVTAIYSILKTVSIREIGENDSDPIATYTPKKVTWLYTQNNPGVILQKMLNPDDFDKDERKPKSIYSLNKDIENISSFYNLTEEEKQNVFLVQNMYNDLRMSNYNPVVMMGYTRRRLDLVDTVTSLLSNAMSRNIKYKISTSGLTNVINPHTGELLYLKENKVTKDIFQQALHSITWLYILLWKNQYTVNQIVDFLLDIKIKKEPFYNALEVLNIFNPSYCETFSVSLEDKKIAAYLRALLLNKYDLIDDISNSIYSYSYNYIIRGECVNDRYIGKSRCAFMYLGQPFEFIQNDNNLPTMYTNTKNPSINKVAYVIALRLSNNISVQDFDSKMYELKLDNYLIEPEKIITGRDYKRCLYLHKKNDKYFFNKDHYRTDDNKTYPIIFTTTRLTQESKSTHLTGNVFPQINDRALCVSVGKYKLFNFPFWRATCYDILTDIKDRYIENIKINFILKEKIMNDYYTYNDSGFKIVDPVNFKDNIIIDFDYYKKQITNKYDFIKELITNDTLKEIYLNKQADDKTNENSMDYFEEEENYDDDGGEMTYEEIMALMGDINMKLTVEPELITDDDNDVLVEPEEIHDEARTINHIPVSFDINMTNLKVVKTQRKQRTKTIKGFYVANIINKKSLYYYMINSIFLSNQLSFQMTAEVYFLTICDLIDKFNNVSMIGKDEYKLFYLCQIDFLLRKGYIRNEKNINEYSIYYEDKKFNFYRKKGFMKENIPSNLKGKRIFFESEKFEYYGGLSTQKEWFKYYEKNYNKYSLFHLPTRKKIHNKYTEEITYHNSFLNNNDEINFI